MTVRVLINCALSPLKCFNTLMGNSFNFNLVLTAFILFLFSFSFHAEQAISGKDFVGTPKKRVVTYDDKYGERRKRAEYQDENVWIYSASFAKRFGMPKKWIDPNLKGAEAVAFRVVPSTFKTCGLFGEKENCFRTKHCNWDVYLNKEDSDKLNWPNDGQRIFHYRIDGRSNQFLIRQYQEDSRDWNSETKKIEYDRSTPQVLKYNALVAGGPVYKGGEKIRSHSSSTAIHGSGYERELVPGLDVLYLFACPFSGPKTEMKIKFDPSRPIKKYVTYEKLYADKKRLSDQGKDSYHEVSFPDSYAKKVMKSIDQYRNRNKTLQSELDKRLNK